MGTPRLREGRDYRFRKNVSDFPGSGCRPIAIAPAPTGGRAGERGAINYLNGISKFILSIALQASAATLSAQVSTFVRIPSSEYEVRFTRSRLIVTMYVSPFGSRQVSVAE